MPYGGAPGSSAEDALRFHAGDTNNDSLLLTDDEVAFALSEGGGDAMLGASLALESLATRFAQQADVTMGRASRSFSQRSQQYASRAQALRHRAGMRSAGIHATGTTVADKEAREQNDGLVQPAFRRGMNRHPQVEGEEEPS